MIIFMSKVLQCNKIILYLLSFTDMKFTNINTEPCLLWTVLLIRQKSSSTQSKQQRRRNRRRKFHMKLIYPKMTTHHRPTCLIQSDVQNVTQSWEWLIRMKSTIFSTYWQAIHKLGNKLLSLWNNESSFTLISFWFSYACVSVSMFVGGWVEWGWR